ncbi:CRISPR-associated helicase Cas3' [Streptomyces sp. CB01881]|uniref:CRISPR-associated helicase Cas3' n=1 Tax=Streptomyces sp. CB01881 TaxID=2078691 RepID=UPI000CDC7C15|nr:CRISPR-associated helicase Cas3' [Streptomyces sp. CB01881]AUY54750.1 CRISPR-associated helicase/endonuclease Cas3 [Streptomyces sp. CB01881]TYC69703.1 CRISPR-associated helicase Cas3' [Streptomyces sp. CB01881]
MAPDPLTPPQRRALTDLRAKSLPREDPERLTAHLRTVHDAVSQLEARVATAGIIATEPLFWAQVRAAALLHDAGKIAESFQRQLEPGGEPWGERHEVLSLAYVDLLAPATAWSAQERLLIATLVASHHRPLHAANSLGGGKPALARLYNAGTRWDQAFGRPPGPDCRPQVPRGLHQELLAWLAGFLRTEPAPPAPGDPTTAARARLLLDEVLTAWREPVKAHTGLIAVLAQGALTLADHAGSAHVELQTHIPLPLDYLARLPHTPHRHQQDAANTTGHLVLIAPTGSGKTEAGLAWAARQLTTMPGLPRLVWTLPYRASLNAARHRFERTLQPEAGQERPDIGLLHGALARTLLTEALEDDCCGPTKDDARKARARANAMRLFTQRLRVATPHQLLAAAIAGPTHSSVLLEQANSLFVLDELHAYDPETFGRLCAAMRLWEQLGSRIAVLSATLAPPLLAIVDETLHHPVTCHRAALGTAPVRHHLVVDDLSLTDPDSLERLETWLDESHSVLVVTNTVTTAQDLFTKLADHARQTRPDDPDAAMLLHSRFKNRDRDSIESRLLARHPERRPGEPHHRGGLVVATQTVEVSLQLDFDRGAVDNAPVEAVAQRAGRVNRLGLHPDGAVEFRVHRTDGHRPYDPGAIEAAWSALTTLVEEGVTTLSEHDIDRLLHLAYDTDWGHDWARRARQARDGFTTEFLTFTDPFHDRTEHAKTLGDRFDTVEVLHHDDKDEYRQLAIGRSADPLLAAGLLIPLRYGQLKTYNATFDRALGIHLIDGQYDPVLGLRAPVEPETIL